MERKLRPQKMIVAMNQENQFCIKLLNSLLIEALLIYPFPWTMVD